jgi:NADH:ubiquinone oxidoreductase subunit
MSKFDSFSLIRRLSQIGTLLQTSLCGEEVGHDQFGNRYYRARGKAPNADKGGVREKRWVMYKGEPEASKVPPEWHIWLHHTANASLPDGARQKWQKPHIENMTGTPDAWMPPALEGKARPKATGDYEAWKPE